MPLYRITIGENDAAKEKLVEANNAAAARNFAVKGMVTVEVAKSVDVFRLAKAGVEIEVATGADDVEVHAQAGAVEQADGEDKPQAKADETKPTK